MSDRRRDGSGAAAEATRPLTPSPLAVVVRRGIDLLGDLRALHPDVGSGALERALRHEVGRALGARGSTADPAVAAVRAACAHLVARSYEDAYLALLAAAAVAPLPHGTDLGKGSP